MCDPLTIGGAVVTGLGTVMQMRSQQQARNKMDSVIRANADEADRLQKDSSKRTLTAAEGFDRPKFDANVSEQTQKTKKDFMDAQSGGALPGEFYGESTSDNVKQYREQKGQESSNYTNRMAEALSRLRGFEGGMRVAGTQTNRAAEQVLLNNNFMQGNNAILPIQLEAAKAKGSNPLADIMVGLGSAGMSAGLSGKTIPGFGGNPNAIANPNIKGTKYLLA
jgi:hypothetical protein